MRLHMQKVSGQVLQKEHRSCVSVKLRMLRSAACMRRRPSAAGSTNNYSRFCSTGASPPMVPPIQHRMLTRQKYKLHRVGPCSFIFARRRLRNHCLRHAGRHLLILIRMLHIRHTPRLYSGAMSFRFTLHISLMRALACVCNWQAVFNGWHRYNRSWMRLEPHYHHL